ncbi:MAG: mevalonate kinase [Candidatus Micrarchaeia archaeon]
MIVKAPAVAKLFGEHAVVYGRLSVAVALDAHASADISYTQRDELEVELPQMGLKSTFSEALLRTIFYRYAFRTNLQDFISQHSSINEHLLPYATISARLLFGYGINVLGKKIIISSDIPIKKGFASSAACSTAFTTAILKHEQTYLPDGEVIEVARDGERILHKNEGAGKIDVSTSFYGGYVSYSSANGARKEHIDKKTDLIFIDTGPKKSTAETVGHVAKLHQDRKDYVESLFDMIERYSADGLEALKNGDFATVGSLMYKNHEALDKLGVSSEGLNRAVEIAKSSGAKGAKLSGGGGGGMAIAIAEGPKVLKALQKGGFEISTYSIDLDGAQTYIKSMASYEYSR